MGFPFCDPKRVPTPTQILFHFVQAWIKFLGVNNKFLFLQKGRLDGNLGGGMDLGFVQSFFCSWRC